MPSPKHPKVSSSAKDAIAKCPISLQANKSVAALLESHLFQACNVAVLVAMRLEAYNFL
jgi:hypothetical protein